jgi:hypothetical protein
MHSQSEFPPVSKKKPARNMLFLLLLSLFTIAALCPGFDSFDWIFYSPEEQAQTELTETEEARLQQTVVEGLNQTDTQEILNQTLTAGIANHITQTVYATLHWEIMIKLPTDNAATTTQQAILYQTQIWLNNPFLHQPAIIYIDFPTRIPSDGTDVRGTIKFTDPLKDVILVTAKVLSTTGNFGDATWDPRANLEYHEDYGLLEFWTWCQGTQLVTQRFTLYDSAGNTSDPVDITFTCE